MHQETLSPNKSLLTTRAEERERKTKSIAEAIANGNKTTKEISTATGYSPTQIRNHLNRDRKSPKHCSYPEGMRIHDWLILDSESYEKDIENGGYRLATPKNTYRFSKCQCLICGKTFFVARQNLVKSLSRSCKPCALKRRVRSIKVINLTTVEEYDNIGLAAQSIGISRTIFASKMRRGMEVQGMRFKEVPKTNEFSSDHPNTES